MNLPDIHALNFCILMAKKYIYTCNFEGKPPLFKSFLCRIKNRLMIEKHIAIQNQNYTKFKERYEPIEKLFAGKWYLNSNHYSWNLNLLFVQEAKTSHKHNVFIWWNCNFKELYHNCVNKMLNKKKIKSGANCLLFLL